MGVLLFIIDITKLKEKLDSIGVNFEESILEDIIDLKIREIQSITGLCLSPLNHHYYSNDFHGSYVMLPYYPIKSIESMTINNNPITDYVLIDEIGVIYFEQEFYGVLDIQYSEGLSEEVMRLVEPLLTDMIIYYLNGDVSKDATSIKEGDITISYDSGLSLGNRINNQLENLKKYSIKIRVI